MAARPHASALTGGLDGSSPRAIDSLVRKLALAVNAIVERVVRDAADDYHGDKTQGCHPGKLPEEPSDNAKAREEIQRKVGEHDAGK